MAAAAAAGAAGEAGAGQQAQPEAEGSSKKQKRSGSVKKASASTSAAVGPALQREWHRFAADLAAAEAAAAAAEGGFAFAFVEGALVKAVREGCWLLLDEMNLAPAEVRAGREVFSHGCGWQGASDIRIPSASPVMLLPSRCCCCCRRRSSASPGCWRTSTLAAPPPVGWSSRSAATPRACPATPRSACLAP